jgi:hypothetical protein
MIAVWGRKCSIFKHFRSQTVIMTPRVTHWCHQEPSSHGLGRAAARVLVLGAATRAPQPDPDARPRPGFF